MGETERKLIEILVDKAGTAGIVALIYFLAKFAVPAIWGVWKENSQLRAEKKDAQIKAIVDSVDKITTIQERSLERMDSLEKRMSHLEGALNSFQTTMSPMILKLFQALEIVLRRNNPGLQSVEQPSADLNPKAVPGSKFPPSKK